jgi:GT2 family glycosyltransferase
VNSGDLKPLIVSVIVLNYNGERWIERCLSSLKDQTMAAQTEVLVADNLSSDGSDKLAAEIVRTIPNAFFIEHGQNLGYCEGNNRAAARAHGEYLFFLNNDAWLEPDCLEKLIAETQHLGASAAGPLVLDYEDDAFQSSGASGFDAFGLATSRLQRLQASEILMPEGCGFLIQNRLFHALGGFDPQFFMFADEFDLAWRVWISGHKAVTVPSARLHHRGAAQVNPAGGGAVIEFRTSDTKRFFANRNALLVLLKNAQHLLLLLVPLQLGLLALEAVAGLVLVRRWGFIKRAYWEAVRDCWRLRHHVRESRCRIRSLRRHSDWWMLRFFRFRLNRGDELLRMLRHGMPKVSAR